MRTVLCSLLLVVTVLTGCDSFEPSDVLLPLADVSTDPAALRSDYAWVAVAAVSDGKAVAFPATGFSAIFAADDYLSGDVAPNGYGGSYTASADGSLSVSDTFYSTAIGGGDERLARAFLSELSQATRFEVEGRTLQVRSEDGDGVRFELEVP